METTHKWILKFAYVRHSVLLLSRAGIGDGSKELALERGSPTVEPPKYDFFFFSSSFHSPYWSVSIRTSATSTDSDIEMGETAASKSTT